MKLRSLFRPPHTSCCGARFLTGRGLARDRGLGTPALRGSQSSLWSDSCLPLWPAVHPAPDLSPIILNYLELLSQSFMVDVLLPCVGRSSFLSQLHPHSCPFMLPW